MNKTERYFRNWERGQLKRYKDECRELSTRQMTDEEFADAQRRREKIQEEHKKQEEQQKKAIQAKFDALMNS